MHLVVRALQSKTLPWLINKLSPKIRGTQQRLITHTPSGGFCPAPEKTSFGLLGIVGAVVPGLLIGATISKYMANFLEENELFVPSDDDDDDDDEDEDETSEEEPEEGDSQEEKEKEKEKPSQEKPK
uniref:Essential MCU regulator, mitochondrial n=1 Tax=Cacopsylla melanoneura TaxID=428564 RepID=A0A8D8UXL5_9HEMI